jgi:hypothetical protein
VSTILFGDSDEFERGFQLGACWQMLRSGLDKVDVVLPRTLVVRAQRLGQASGYHVTVRKVNNGLRFVRFTSTR